MRHGLIAQCLTDLELPQAYTLVGLCHEKVTLAGWQDHVAASERPHSAVWSAVRDRRGYMHAIYSHRVDHDLVAGRNLLLGDIVAPGSTWRATLLAIEADALLQAGEQGCTTIRLALHPGRQSPSDSQLRELLCPLGWVEWGPWLWRQVGGPET